MQSELIKKNNSRMIKKKGSKKYGLDNIFGVYDSCIAWFSYYRISNKYKGYCCQIVRESDYATKDIGFASNGYINVSDINDFCSGTTGKVSIWYNQSGIVGVKNAIQTTFNNSPIIYESSTFNLNGLNFVAASSNRMVIDDYAELQITSDPISLYYSHLHASSQNGFIFARNESLGTDVQYGLLVAGTSEVPYINFVQVASLAGAHSIGSFEKSIFEWIKGANNTKSKSTKNTATGTQNDNLTNKSKTTIGSRASYSVFYNGNIKTIALFNSAQYNNYDKLSNF